MKSLTQVSFSILLTLLLIISCSKKVIKKPAPETVTKKYDVAFKKEYGKNDFAKSVKFDRGLKKVKRVSVKYNLSSDSGISEDDIKQSNWHTEIEKSLIRLGFIINDEKEKEEFLLDEEEKEEIKCDAQILIDKVDVKKVETFIPYALNGTKDGSGKYNYKYFILEINGKMILKNNDILWSCNLVTSSFDLIKMGKKEKPSVTIRGIREYRYSEKLKKWVRDKWMINSKDNFGLQLSNKIDEEFHKRKLVRYSISKFFETLIPRKAALNVGNRERTK